MIAYDLAQDHMLTSDQFYTSSQKRVPREMHADIRIRTTQNQNGLL